MRSNGTRAAFILILGLFADPLAAGQEGTDMKLEDAGFKMRIADTGEKLSHARLLPPRKFIARIARAGQHYYIYADPDFCKCVFVGDESAMKTYRDMVTGARASAGLAPPGVTPEMLMVQDIDADVSSTITDGHILDVPF